MKKRSTSEKRQNNGWTKRILAMILALALLCSNNLAALQTVAADEKQAAMQADTKKTESIETEGEKSVTPSESKPAEGAIEEAAIEESTEDTQITENVPEEVQEQPEEEYSSVNWTNAVNQLNLFIYQLRYQEADTPEVIVAAAEDENHTYSIDLQNMDLDKLERDRKSVV